MKKADLATGVVYAYQTSPYDRPDPMVLLDSARLYSFTRVHGWDGPSTSQPLLKVSDATMPTKGGLGREAGSGYLAITPASPHQVESNGTDSLAVEDLLTVTTLEQVLALNQTQSLDFNFHVRLVNNRFLVGVYDEVVAERQRREQAQQQARQRRDENERAAAEALSTRMHALQPLVPGDFPSQTSVRAYDISDLGKVKITLTLDQVDALLALIPQAAPEAVH